MKVITSPVTFINKLTNGNYRCTIYNISYFCEIHQYVPPTYNAPKCRSIKPLYPLVSAVYWFWKM